MRVILKCKRCSKVWGHVELAKGNIVFVDRSTGDRTDFGPAPAGRTPTDPVDSLYAANSFLWSFDLLVFRDDRYQAVWPCRCGRPPIPPVKPEKLYAALSKAMRERKVQTILLE